MTKPGVDLLGLAHPLFPASDIINHTPKDTPIGFFWGDDNEELFGDARPRLRLLLQKGFTTFRIQMFWSDNHAIVPLPILEQSLNKLKEVLYSVRPKGDPVGSGNEELQLYISPSCEHAETNAVEVRKRLELVKAIIPSSTPVNNPLPGHGAEIPGYPLEYHGGNPGKCQLASTDGTNIYDIDAEKWVGTYGNRLHPCFIWGARFNLREISDEGQDPPPIPQRKAAPSLQYYLSILRLTRPKGSIPDTHFKFHPLGSTEIYKTHAEDDQEDNENTPDEKRENRPVLIIRPNVPQVDILASNGTVIGKFTRYGSFPGGLTRYYSGLPGAINLYGYEIGDKARKISGSEYVGFRAGKTMIGLIHPAFRAGRFR